MYSFEVSNLKTNCNPMFDVNVKILSELKNFITIVSFTRELLSKFCSSDKDFSRSRKLPFDKLALFIIKLCKKTLSVELERYFEELNNSTPCSVSAYTQQRCKLHSSFPPVPVDKSFPEAVPKFAVPELTLIKPVLSYEKEPMLFKVAPFTQKPALFDKLGFELN